MTNHRGADLSGRHLGENTQKCTLYPLLTPDSYEAHKSTKRNYGGSPATFANMTFDWETHKPLIRRLYIDEGRTLEDIQDLMKTVHDFAPRYDGICCCFSFRFLLTFSFSPTRHALTYTQIVDDHGNNISRSGVLRRTRRSNVTMKDSSAVSKNYGQTICHMLRCSRC